MASLVLLVPQDYQELMDSREMRDTRDFLVYLDLLAHQDLKAVLESELRVQREIREQQDLLGDRDLQDLCLRLVLILRHQGRQVSRVILEKRAILVSRENEAPLETVVYLVYLVQVE